jgi:hypothetical protein
MRPWNEDVLVSDWTCVRALERRCEVNPPSASLKTFPLRVLLMCGSVVSDDKIGATTKVIVDEDFYMVEVEVSAGTLEERCQFTRS